MLERLGNVRVATIRIGRVEKAQALVITVQQEIRESLYAEGGLVRVMSYSHGPSAHGEATSFDSSAAKGHSIGCAEFLREVRNRPNAARQVRSQPCGANSVGGSCQEFSALHKASTRNQSVSG